MSFKVKSFLVVLVVLIVAYVFFGCGRTDTAPSQDETVQQ